MQTLSAAVVFIAGIVIATGAAPVARERDIVGLGGPDAGEKASKLIGEYDELGWKLVRELSDPASTDQQRNCAAYLIGRLRVRQGAPELVRQIDMKIVPVPGLSRRLAWKYPAAEALTRLPSSAAVTELVAHLATEREESRRALMLTTLVEIAGPSCARVRLESAIERFPEDAKRAKLQQAVADLDRRLARKAKTTDVDP